MQTFPTKLNIWQEVHVIESNNQAKIPNTPQDENNQAPQETWFQLLQYPTHAEQASQDE